MDYILSGQLKKSSPVPLLRKGEKYTGTPTPEELDISERFLISKAQADFKAGESESLLPETVLTKGHSNSDIPIILFFFFCGCCIWNPAPVRMRYAYIIIAVSL